MARWPRGATCTSAPRGQCAMPVAVRSSEGLGLIRGLEHEKYVILRLPAAWPMFPDDCDKPVEYGGASPCLGGPQFCFNLLAFLWVAPLKAVLQLPHRFLMAEKPTRTIGVEPDKHETFVWGSEAAAEYVVQRIQVSLPGMACEDVRAEVRCELLERGEGVSVDGEALHMRPNVGAEGPEPARHLGRETDDDTGGVAAQVPCRWRSPRATG